MKNLNKNRCKIGFTLAEILLAMLVFSIAISTILALLARSIETADSIIIKDQAMGLSSAVDNYMSEIAFTDAYNEIQSGPAVLFAYEYRADPASSRTDGTLQPYPVLGQDDVLGEDYVVVPGIRITGDTELQNDLQASEGRLFQVRLSLSPANPYDNDSNPNNDVILPSDPNAAGSGGLPAYDQAVLVIFAEFFQVPNINFTVAQDTEPIFSFNFAVRR